MRASTTSIDEASADVTLTLRDGRTHAHVRIEHAIGSLRAADERRGTSREKFHGLVDPILGADAATTLVGLCEELPRASSVRALTAAARPG